MPAAIPLVAVVAAGVASAAVGGGIVGELVGAGAALLVSAVGGAVFRIGQAGRATTHSSGRSAPHSII